MERPIRIVSNQGLGFVFLLGAFLGGCASFGAQSMFEEVNLGGHRVHVYEKDHLPELAYQRLGEVTGVACRTDVYSEDPTRAEAIAAMKKQVARSGGNGAFEVNCRLGPSARCSRARLCSGTAIRVLPVDALPRVAETREASQSEKKDKSGTGWVLAPGLVLTSHQLVKGRSTFSVSTADTTVSADLVARDAVQNLALLRPPHSFELPSPLPLATDSVPTGRRVFTVGYPSVDAEIRTATGVVSAQSGIQGDGRVYRADVGTPLDKGGAPLLNFRGEVVGVLVPASISRRFNVSNAAPSSVSHAVKNKYVRRLRAGLSEGAASGKVSAESLPLSRSDPALPSILDAVRPSILRVTAR